MSVFCPVCGRLYCDHTPEERNQDSSDLDKHMESKEDFIKWFGEEQGLKEFEKRKSNK